jgi:hypothetical protein
MAIPKFEEDLNIISKLGDYPGSTDNLTSEQFKAKFDEAALKIQRYLNGTLVPSVDQIVDVQALLNGILDSSLSDSTKAANAKATGDALAKKANLTGCTFTGYVSGIAPTAAGHFAPKQYVDSIAESTKAATLLKAYPVGAIYISTANTSPASLFGGTWTQLKDRFLLGAGNTYSAGATGGAATVTLTVDQMPKHTHDLSMASKQNTGSDYSTSYLGLGESGNTNYTNDNPVKSAGGGKSHNNMPPYLVVYMWKRTA